MASKKTDSASVVQDARRARERLTPEDRRAQIVAAALDLLVESHAIEPSFSNLADRLGISRNLIYHYFSSPAMLLDAVVENECRTVMAEVAQTVHATEGLHQRARLESVLLAYIRVISQRMQFVRLVTGSSEAAKIFNDYLSQNEALIFDVILALVPHHPPQCAADAPCMHLAIRAWIEFLRLFMHSLVMREAPFDDEAIARYAADVVTVVIDGASRLHFDVSTSPAAPSIVSAAATADASVDSEALSKSLATLVNPRKA